MVEGRYEYEWHRIKDQYDPAEYSLFGSQGIRPEDIFQGSIGNCWLMSALSSIAEKPNRVEKLFVNEDNAINEAGVYGIKIYALGVPHTVLVDDYLPMTVENGKRMLLFSRTSKRENVGDKSLWGPIFEKAFAKFNGNYFHLEGGYNHLGIESINGGPYEIYEDTDVEVLW